MRRPLAADSPRDDPARIRTAGVVAAARGRRPAGDATVPDVDEELPDYAPMLADYHAAFADELTAMVAGLPIASGDRVLDMACGDGTFSVRLADRVGPGGAVWAVDLRPRFLARARERAAGSSLGAIIRHAAADVARLPFGQGTFDLAWCAQSLYSLPDPVAALRSLGRVVRRGGTVAVLEDDTLHHVLLPWPVEIELEVRRAEWEALAGESRRPGKYYVGRRLVQVFREAGFVECTWRTWATDRRAPLRPRERGFLEKYLADLKGRVLPLLAPGVAARFGRIVDPGSDAFLLDDPDLAVTIIDHVAWGVTP